MSKVAISGGATGSATYTIQAPTGSTDRTLTLPDEAGTVLTSGGAIADALNVDSAPTNSLGVDASGNLQFNSGYGSVATAYGCRAWVQFDMSNGVIAGDGNVSSLTDDGTGEFTVNFTNSMPDTNYSPQITAEGGSVTAVLGTFAVNQIATSSLQVQGRLINSNNLFDTELSVAIFR